MKIFVTGGAGYIGSHTLLQLLRAQHEVLVFDNFSNSSIESLNRVKKMTNSNFEIFQGDIRSKIELDEAFSKFRPEVVLHFAGLKAVEDSQKDPLKYYEENVFGSIALLNTMQHYDCWRIVFSSSATVYGTAKYLPYDENHPLQPSNAYGRTKLFIEEIIRDWIYSTMYTSAVLLRYFNPVGADKSGRIGEDPNGTPNNLVPYLSQVAVGRLKQLSIFGGDYKTRDGTGERDYIHVEDLAQAHLMAIDFSVKNIGCEAFNIGTGYGVTVLELVREFEKVSGRKIPYQIGPRRDGDIARSVAAVDKADRLLGWRAKLDVNAMCQPTWNWQLDNPSGYKK